MIRINVTSVFVDDQDKALKFYTEKLGFIKKTDIPVGEYKWLTVVSPAEPNGVELLLEPDQNPAAQAYKQSIFEQGIPATSFAVDDIQAEYERMQALGVEFTAPPAAMGPVTIATLNDTCGNLIQIAQMMG
jgi:catechol 2,3-dioxygenase-like lactoylglutathione lyase family enzyme